MVTSFRPKCPLIKDDSVLTTVRAISDLSELYGGYAEYRLEMLEEIRNLCSTCLATASPMHYARDCRLPKPAYSSQQGGETRLGAIDVLHWTLEVNILE